MAAPTLSIVVAAYQSAHTIGTCLDSAFAQTMPPLEVIVCDDGSTDDLHRALDPYRDRLTLLRQPNRGEGAAKNAAIEAASGEFVVILDADDVFDPRRLEALGSLAAARPDLDILTTDAYVEVDGAALRTWYGPDNPFPTDGQEVEILRRNFVFGLPAVRRRALCQIGGFDESIRRTTDWDSWIRLLLTGSRVGLVDHPLASYRLQPTTLSADRAAMTRGALQTLRKAERRGDLSDAQRAAVTATIAARQRRLHLLEAQEAVRLSAPDRRERLLRVARDRGQPRMTRGKAVAAMLAPNAARRRWSARTAGSWTGPGGIHVSGD